MQVNTVLGKVKVDNLGIILPHEHLHLQFECALKPTPTSCLSYPSKNEETFLLPNLGVVRQYPYSSVYNCHLDDTDAKKVMVEELCLFKQAGGTTIVENTIEGINRDIKWLKELSEKTGVHIIAGTGYYVTCSQNKGTLGLSTEQMHDTMLQELTQGIDGIKCGIIGEIGITWPMEGFEKRVVKAVAALQEELNAPISFHPGRNPESPFEIIRVFTEAGGKSEDVIMSHLDRTIFKNEILLEFAEFKTFLQYDLFGTECSHYQYQEEVDMPSDAQRLDKIKMLVDNGHLRQVTMSHDIHTKHRLASFGGHGYHHILTNIQPKMKSKGFSQTEIDCILKENPKRWLSRGNF